MHVADEFFSVPEGFCHLINTHNYDFSRVYLFEMAISVVSHIVFALTDEQYPGKLTGPVGSVLKGRLTLPRALDTGQ
jgi:hypothetical protein